MKAIPPIGSPSLIASSTSSMLIELRRVARGWRWRVIALGFLVAAWWFSRGAGFGLGATVHFPGGASGVLPFCVTLALLAAIMASDAVACWERSRAAVLLQHSVCSPFVQCLHWTVTVLAALFPLAVVYTAWPLVGALREGLSINIVPSAFFLLVVALPTLVAGAGAGLLSRLALRNDALAFAGSALLLSPVIFWRLRIADPADLFQLASPSLGVLIPAPLLVGDATWVTLFGAALIAIATVLLRRFRVDEAGIPASSYLYGITATFRLNGMIATAAAVVGLAAAIVIARGPLAFGEATLGFMPGGSDLSRPTALKSPPPLHSREIVLDPSASEPIRLTLVYTKAPTEPFAISFGSALEVAHADGGSVSPLRLEGGTGAVQVTPADQATSFGFLLRPSIRGRRVWEECWHPGIHRFAPLGAWWGTSYTVEPDGTALPHNEMAVYTIQVPPAAPLEWNCSTATSEPQADGTILLRSNGRGLPAALVASNSVDLCTSGSIALCLRTLNQRGTFASQFPRLYEVEYARLARIFPRGGSINLYEIPDAQSPDPFALSSFLLNELSESLPTIDDFEKPTRPLFDALFEPIHRESLRRLHLARYNSIEYPDFLGEGLAAYLHRFAYAEGKHGDLTRKTRRDLAFVPWNAPLRERRPFDLAKGERELWSGPLLPGDHSAIAVHRILAIHHMLRGVLGEEPYLGFLRSLDEVDDLTLAAFRARAERAYGKPLDWFFADWIDHGACPDYAVLEGDALLLRETGTRALTYRVSVEIENRGTGTMPVPWRLQTEGDPITGKEWLGPESRATIQLTTIDRPLVFEIDPDGWIAQFVPSAERGTPPKARVFFKTIREL
ncbi:hypothetical protein GC173_12385 [bacterium]|nr:hypothetical protein [bacterium]